MGLVGGPGRAQPQARPTYRPKPSAQTCVDAGADIVKFAAMANDISDAARVLAALRRASARGLTAIGLAMGERGLPSRLLAPKCAGWGRWAGAGSWVRGLAGLCQFGLMMISPTLARWAPLALPTQVRRVPHVWRPEP